MLSADKVLHVAFERMLQKQNVSSDALPPTLFSLNERTGVYRWPGLEPRFRDFVAGAKWFSDELNATNSVMKQLSGKSLVK